MIKRLGTITYINLHVYGEPITQGIEGIHPQASRMGIELPTQQAFNSHWRVEHTCANCGEVATFGDDWDSEAKQQRYPFIEIKNLFTKYYTVEFLQALADIFPSTNVFSSEKSPYLYLTDTTFADVDTLYIPHKQFLFYQCPSCGAMYLCRYRQALPTEPERGIAGQLGILFIDEIAHIAISDGKSFERLLQENRRS